MANTTTTERATSFRWVVMLLAFAIVIVSYMDRSALAYASAEVKREFGLNDQQLGVIFSAFGLGYAFMTLGGGILADKFGARRVWSLSAVSWSLMTAMLGLVSGFYPLCAIRVLLGLTEGPCFPSLNKVVTDWLPLAERSRATAFGLVAVPLASVVGAPFISQLILHLGWKVMFTVLASLGIAWSIAWIALYRDYPENCRNVNGIELAHIRAGQTNEQRLSDAELRSHRLSLGKTTWKFMLSNPALLANDWAFFAFGYLLFFAIHWLPEYLANTYGLPLEKIGTLLMVPWATAAAMLAGTGFLSDYLWKKTHSFRIARSHVIWVCQLLSALCLVPVVMVHSLNVALLFLSLGLGFGLAPNACFYNLNSDLAGDRAGTSLGLMTCLGSLAAILAPALTGYLRTLTGNFNSAIGLLIIFSMTSVVAVLIFQHPDRHTSARTST